MKTDKALDVHGLTLSQAKNVIKNAINIAYDNNTPFVLINHGFNNGSKIKTWCKNEVATLDKVIKVDSGDNEGISKIYIKINISKL